MFKKLANKLKSAWPFGKNKGKKDVNVEISPATVSQNPAEAMVESIASDNFVWVDAGNYDVEKEAGKRAETLQLMHEYALSEKLAHSSDGAYGAPKRAKGQIIELQDGPGLGKNQYRTVPIITESSGLVGEIFVPKNPSNNPKVYVNWTGTHSLGTVLADLEKNPGEESYRKEEQTILGQINQVVGAVHKVSGGQKVDLSIHGHSLGGALAQLNTHSIQRALATDIALKSNDSDVQAQWVQAESDYRLSLRSKGKSAGQLPISVRSHLTADVVSSVSIGTWNSAGVVKAVENSSNALAPVLSSENVHVKARFGMVAGDGVQATGQGTILSDVDPVDADVSAIKMFVGQEEGFMKKLGVSPLGVVAATAGTIFLGAPLTIAGGLAIALARFGVSTGNAHVSKHFVDPEHGIARSEIYRNDTPEGRSVLKSKLGNKSSFLNAKPVRTIQRGLYYLAKQFISPVKDDPYSRIRDAHIPDMPEQRSKRQRVTVS